MVVFGRPERIITIKMVSYFARDCKIGFVFLIKVGTCREIKMMMPNKIFGFVAGSMICLLLLVSGCAQPPTETFGGQPTKEAPKTKLEREETAKVEPKETIKPEVKKEETIEIKVEPKETIKPEVKPEKQGPAVQLALKFAADDLTTYKVITEVEKSVKWEGPLPDKNFAFKGGATGNRVEMTFAQRIQSVNDKGNAVAQITVKGLKYSGKVKDNVVLDFDSSREKDVNNPLCKLIGQSYTIEISPAGQVLRVIEVSPAQAAVEGSSSANKTALALLATDVIKERHTIPGLPVADKNQLRTGDNWSSIKAFSFDMMGAKSYEKLYTLKEIKEVNNRQIAVAEMKAIPSSEMAEELHKEQATGVFTKMFDNTEAYSGQLKLDLTAGRIEEYFEKLQTEWIMVDPKPEPNKEPAALKMAATRLYSIEKID